MTERAERLGNEQGALLFMTVLSLLLLSIFIVSLATVARNELFMANADREGMRAAYAAESGASHGRQALDQLVRVSLPAQVAGTNRTALAAALNAGTYSGGSGGAALLTTFAIPGAGPTFARCDTAGGCPEPAWHPGGQVADDSQVILQLQGVDPAYDVRVIVATDPTAPPVITNVGEGGQFNYLWRIESTGYASRDAVGLGPRGWATQQVTHDSRTNTRPSGRFTVALNGSFVQYAHFIDSMDSTSPWISFRHVYTGPVHVNTRMNILGNPNGPTFRSEASQTFLDIRFNNGGSATTIQRDSTVTNDWPLLGDTLTPCKLVDCFGLTRGLDFNPQTVALDPVPFPNTADATTLASQRAQLRRALGPTACALPCVTPSATFVLLNASTPVVVGNTLGVAGTNGTLDGGIVVNGNALDFRLRSTGPTIEIYTANVGAVAPGATDCSNFACASNRRTIISENRGLAQITVTRQCWRRNAGGPPAPSCGTNNGTGANGWNDDSSLTGGALASQTINGLLSPSLTQDFGIIYVGNTPAGANPVGTASIGTAGTVFGLRRDPLAGTTAAIEQNTRLTIAADRHIYITGNLNYAVDPRGANGTFEAQGSPVIDDTMAVQNVLGIVSWDGGVYLSTGLPALGDVMIHGMIMAPNITRTSGTPFTGNGVGEFHFGAFNAAVGTGSACGTSYRGIVRLLGGVIQETMGCLGQPGIPGNGYARDWIYDERYRRAGLGPPEFPLFPTFTANSQPGIRTYSWRSTR